jgi:hypothetical protein
MNRRDLNRILMIGTALAGGWPAWLRRAFGADSGPACQAPAGPEGELRWRRIVAAAYRRAQQAGKPLLAFVVPALDEETAGGYDNLWLRGRGFGELLTHGNDEVLATLALAEVVCAPMSALRALAPDLGGEPLMVLIEATGAARALDAHLPDGRIGNVRLDRAPGDWEVIFAEQRQAEDECMEARIAVLSHLLHRGLRATPRMLLERAAQARARLGSQPPGLPDEAGQAHLYRVSPILLASAVAQPERERQLTIQRIADAARFVLCRRRVPGSRWAGTV